MILIEEPGLALQNRSLFP